MKIEYQKTKNGNFRLYKLRNGDMFSCDMFHPPLSIPVVIHGVDFYYVRKWYNPVSWFKKHWVTKYEYICCKCDE